MTCRHPVRHPAIPLLALCALVHAAAGGRRIVLALDYLHLGPTERELVFDQAREMVINGASGDDEIMVAALTGGLRIEQGFSPDHERTLRTLKRMRYDVSLWTRAR